MRNLIGQKNNQKQPSSANGMMYGCSVGASLQETSGLPYSVVDAQASKPLAMNVRDKSEGKKKALAVGCNANNGNASARTANCNNAVSNSNTNYAGAFAVKQVERNEKHLTSQATSQNKVDNHTATSGHGLDDYRSLPFWGEDGEEIIGNDCYPTEATIDGYEILQELSTANRKRKLKNLKRFITNPIIVRMGVERCLSRASNSPEVRKAKRVTSNAIIPRTKRLATSFAHSSEFNYLKT